MSERLCILSAAKGKRYDEAQFSGSAVLDLTAPIVEGAVDEEPIYILVRGDTFVRASVSFARLLKIGAGALVKILTAFRSHIRWVRDDSRISTSIDFTEPVLR